MSLIWINKINLIEQYTLELEFNDKKKELLILVKF
jgi:hypothetical protein